MRAKGTNQNGKKGQGEGKRDNKIIIVLRAGRGEEGIQERQKKTGVTGDT